MPETLNDRKAFSLVEVTRSIKKTLQDRYQSSFWVKAEMNKLNFYKRSGHCYPELVEKQDGKVVAQIRCILWKADYSAINKRFIEVLKEPLKDGIKILFQAKITFDSCYGLSLQILDIDPGFTLGDLEHEKQETIKKLEQEGLFYKNKSLQLPQLPQRIAIISVETSKGYADFLRVIEGNDWNYKFFHYLFPSLLQGEGAITGIMKQLKIIKKVAHHFDVIAIIRGGGGDVGLSCYNNYKLAKAIVNFPLPVITGIGHATNETVSELVSFYNAITPTKLAEYLIQKFHNFSIPVKRAEEIVTDRARKILEGENKRLESEVKYFRSITKGVLNENKGGIKELANVLSQQSHFIFREERNNLKLFKKGLKRSASATCLAPVQELKHYGQIIKKDVSFKLRQHSYTIEQNSVHIEKNYKHIFKSQKAELTAQVEKLAGQSRLIIQKRESDLRNTEKSIQNMSPENVLKRGYSITLLNGKALTSNKEVKKGDKLSTRIFEGNIESIVQSTSNEQENE